MVNYQCKRCGYSTHIRTHYRNHLYKKFICPPNLSKIPRSKLCREFEDLLKDTPIYSTVLTRYKNENKKNENWHTKCSKVAHKCAPTQTSENPKMAHKMTHKWHTNEKSNKYIKKPKKYECVFCQKCFTRSSSMRRHEQRFCKYKYDKYTIEIQKLKKEIQELKNSNNAFIHHTTNNMHNSHNIHNITNNITLQTYGNEEFKYIAQELLQNFQTNPYESIPRLVGLIHFNPEHPENHNVRWINVNKNYLRIYEKEEGWISKNKKDVLRDLNDQAYFAVDTEYDPKSTSLNDSQKKTYEQFRHEYDNGIEKTIKKLEKKTELMILDKRYIVNKTK